MKIFNFILALLLLATTSYAQREQEVKKRPKRADNFTRMHGLRVGLDLTRPMQHFWFTGDRIGTELTFDIELIPNFFPVLETGWETLKIDQDYLAYNSSGSYSRIGFDYNFLAADHKKDMDILFVGLRYGFSFANQEVNSYRVQNYWGDLSSSYPKQKYNSQWFEVLLGIKGEILHNLFLGWTIRGKLKTFQKDFDLPPVYFNPGYGKAENKFNFDFTYTVSYILPFDLKE